VELVREELDVVVVLVDGRLWRRVGGEWLEGGGEGGGEGGRKGKCKVSLTNKRQTQYMLVEQVAQNTQTQKDTSSLTVSFFRLA